MGDWLLEVVSGLTLARCGGLLGLGAIAHAFSTRQADGNAGFDLGPPDRDDDLIEDRRRRFCAAAGLKERPPLILRQQHGSEIIRAPMADDDRLPEADGILVLRGEDSRHVAAVRTADCVPILIADRRGRAAAAVHAGWRGTAAGIARLAVEKFAGIGIKAGDLRAALGPSIGPCCYEVGPEVLRAVGGGSGRQLDLAGANFAQLRSAGLKGSEIFRAPWCTACRTDLFFSYRREGRAAGRLMACIGWAEKRSP
jgi:YfiH family protein